MGSACEITASPLGVSAGIAGVQQGDFVVAIDGDRTREWSQTEVLAARSTKPDPHGALNMPLYQNAAYEFPTAESMEQAFTGRSADHAYSRITNPTVEYFEQRVRQVTGALSVTAFNSGMAAITNLLMTVARAGSNVVTSPHLFGNTYSLLRSTLADFGVGTRAAPFRQLCAKLYLHGCFGIQQCLLIGIHADKFNTAQTALHHAVNSVTAAAADANYFDICNILQFFIEDKRHDKFPLKDNFNKHIVSTEYKDTRFFDLFQ